MVEKLMQELELINQPNQTFSVTLEGTRYTLTLNTMTDTCLCATIARAGETVISGIIVVRRRPLIPFESIQRTYGNFIFDTPDGEIPHYDHFGSTHKFYYVTASELSEAGYELL